MSETVTIGGYDRVSVTLSDGFVLECDPPTMSQAARFLRALHEFEETGNNIQALMELYELPGVLGKEKEFDEHVHAADFVRVVSDFIGALYSLAPTPPVRGPATLAEAAEQLSG